MTKEGLIALEVKDQVATKIAVAHKEELEGYVEKGNIKQKFANCIYPQGNMDIWSILMYNSTMLVEALIYGASAFYLPTFCQHR